MRTISVDMDDLEMAFDSRGSEMAYYLDTETTGRCVALMSDDSDAELGAGVAAGPLATKARRSSAGSSNAFSARARPMKRPAHYPALYLFNPILFSSETNLGSW